MKHMMLASWLLVACGSAPAPQPAAAAAKPAPAAPKATPSAATTVQPECLAKIDAADGTADKVGHKCPNCGLAMEGRAEFSTTVDGFELHSCSEACKEALATNTASVTTRACAH